MIQGGNFFPLQCEWGYCVQHIVPEGGDPQTDLEKLPSQCNVTALTINAIMRNVQRWRFLDVSVK